MNSKINTKKLCAIAMLIAVSFVLGALAIRIGSLVKISFKFIPVFVCSSLYGPILGGLCGWISDFLSYFLNPGSGAYMPQISLVEFLYGFSYGLFFYKENNFNKKNIIKVFICTILNTIILSLFLMSYFLKDMFGYTFIQAVCYRSISIGINTLIQILAIPALLKYMPFFKKMAKIK